MDTDDLPLSALLSKVLVAFTIEFDNELEHKMPHRMAISRSLGLPEQGPWLVSQAMWANFMRYVPEEGRSVAEIKRLSHTLELPLAGMQRWGYVVVKPDPTDSRPKPPSADWIVRPTHTGRMAQDLWRPLTRSIEVRWQERFGQESIAQLRDALGAVLDQVDAELPSYLPGVGYGLWTKGLIKNGASLTEDARDLESSVDLSVLLAQTLLIFAMKFESESRLSLAICANCLRVLDVKGVRMRDLPVLTGVSKEAIEASAGLLHREGYLTIEADPAENRTKLAVLTDKGIYVQKTALERLRLVEMGWLGTYGTEIVRQLRLSLAHFFDDLEGEPPLLSRSFKAYPGSWRLSKPYMARTTAIIRDPASALPQFPIVTHRGGYPDGS